MKVKLEFAATLKIGGLQSGTSVYMEEGTTVAGLLTRYRLRPEQQRFIFAVVNGHRAGLRHVLQDKDLLALFLPVGGG